MLDGRELVAAVVEGLARGTDPAIVAARFHASLAATTSAAAARAAGERGLDTVVLSGGVFQNRLLLEQTAAGISAHGLELLRPERLPPNDGGIAYGQAAVAAANA
jgi:hydrogenase maturation protein HypF